MSVDLQIYSKGTFCEPSKAIADNITQQYLALLLTTVGTITQDPKKGTILPIGSSNLLDAEFAIKQAHHNISTDLGFEPELISITEATDGFSMEVSLNGEIVTVSGVT